MYNEVVEQRMALPRNSALAISLLTRSRKSLSQSFKFDRRFWRCDVIHVIIRDISISYRVRKKMKITKISGEKSRTYVHKQLQIVFITFDVLHLKKQTPKAH